MAAVTSRPTTTRRRRISRMALRENIDAYVFLAPWLVGLFGLILGPMIGSILLAMVKWDILSDPEWVGLDNFKKIFLKDDLFLISLGNTVFYTFLAIPIFLVVSLLLAVALNEKLKFVNYFRTMVYLPAVTPSVAFSLLWVWIFNPDFGIANQFLDIFGIPPQNWIWDPVQAKPSFILMNLWAIGPTMVIFLAGLQSVPETMYEAASIDGANALHRFRHITLPMMSPIIFFNLIVGIIGSFQIFNSAFIMTQGGPGNATLFYVLYLYRQAWELFHFGYASALAWILFVIVLIFTLIQFRLARRWVFYEGDIKT